MITTKSFYTVSPLPGDTDIYISLLEVEVALMGKNFKDYFSVQHLHGIVHYM